MIFVVHNPGLAERRADLTRSLEIFGWTAEWIERPAAADLGILQFVRYRVHPRLSRPQASVYLKHLEVFRRVRDRGMATAFVLEDDPVFPAGFLQRFDGYLASLPADADIIAFGASCGLEAPADPSHPRFAAVNRVRSMSGYVITPRCCAALLEDLDRRPLRLPIDLAVDDVIRRRSLRAYWSVPALIENGSEIGRYPRALTKGAWRRHPAVRALVRFGSFGLR